MAEPDTPALQTEDRLSEGAVCRSVEDLYSVPSRALITQVFQSFLDEKSLTATELLHIVRAQKELQNHNHRSAFLQRIANLQARQTGEAPGIRLRDLTRLAEEAGRATQQRLRQIAVPEIDPATFPAMAEELLAVQPGFPGRFIVDAALAHRLAAKPSFAAKAGTLLSLCEAEAAGEKTAALACVDQILGEILASPAGLTELLGAPDGLRPVLDAIAALALDEPLALPTAPPELHRLAAALKGLELPAARKGLVVSLHRELARDDRLVPSLEGDLLGTKALLEELLATGALAARLKPSGSFIGGRRTSTLLDRRVSLLLTDDKLEEILRGGTYYKKLKDLFSLQQAVTGDYSRRIIDSHLKAMLDSRDFAGRLLDCSRQPWQKLRSLADIQRLVLKSQFSDDERINYARMMDEIHYTYLRTNRVLAPLGKEHVAEPKDVLEALDLVAEGAFTMGKSVNWVRSLLLHHAQNPPFIRACLAGIQAPEERSRTLAELNAKLVAAEVKVRDLGKLRVLVAEDEESARSYIEMILRDLGVTSLALAADGREALGLFKGNEDGFDLVICDWKMPRMSGLEFLKQVRSMRPALPFLMVTALATLAAVEEAMIHEVTAYIAKPFPPEQLEEKVMVLINR